MTVVPAGKFHDIVCMYEFIKDKKDKDRKKAQDKINKAYKLKKKIFKVKDVPKQLSLTQVSFNKLRRLQELEWFKKHGKQPECISCGKTNMDWCCGHFKTVGAQGVLRFDEVNTYLQCNRYCNMGKSGNISGDKNTRGYIQGLHDRFGQQKAEAIIDYCTNKTQPRKWTGMELMEMRKEFNKQIRELEASL